MRLTKGIVDFAWVSASSALNAISQLVYIGVLARTLTQSQFGLQVLVQLVLLFVLAVTERGVEADRLVSISQKPSQGIQIPVFQYILVASILCLIAALALFFIKSISDGNLVETSSFWLLLVVPFFSTINGSCRLDMQINKRFSVLSAVECAGHLCFLIAVLVFYQTTDLSAIYIGWVAQSFLVLFLCTLVTKPSFRFEVGWLGEHSRNYIFERALTSSPAFVDRPLISNSFSLSEVAIFDNALKLAIYPSSKIVPIVSRLIEPSLVEQNFQNTSALQRSYEYHTYLMFPLLLPYAALLLLDPSEVITLLLGAGWTEVTNVARMFGLISMLSILTGCGASYLFAAGKSEFMFKWSFVNLFSIFALMAIAAFSDLSFYDEFVFLYTSLQLLMSVIFLVFIKKYLNISIFNLVIKFILASIVMLTVMFVATSAMPTLTAWLLITSCSCIGLYALLKKTNLRSYQGGTG